MESITLKVIIIGLLAREDIRIGMAFAIGVVVGMGISLYVGRRKRKEEP